MTTITSNQAVTQVRLKFLDALRAIAIILVIGIHALSYIPELSSAQRSWLALGLTTVAVPIFFLTDGYLLARGLDRKPFSYSAFISNSGKRLLVPWFLFTGLYTIFRYLLERAGVLPELLLVGDSAGAIALKAYGSVVSAQLYFLLSLFIIRTFSPLFVKLYRLESTSSFYLLCAALIVSANICLGVVRPLLSIPNGQEPVLHAIWGVQFYVIGLMLARIGEIVISHGILALQILTFCVALYLYKGLALESHLFLQYTALLLKFSIIMRFEPNNRMLSYIGLNTMEVYLLHSPIILKAVSMGAVFVGLTGMAGFSLTVGLTLLLSLLTASLLKTLPFGHELFGVFQAIKTKSG